MSNRSAASGPSPANVAQDLVARGAQPDGDLVPAPAALPATVDKQKSHRAPVFVRHHASVRCGDHQAKPAREHAMAKQ